MKFSKEDLKTAVCNLIESFEDKTISFSVDFGYEEKPPER